MMTIKIPKTPIQSSKPLCFWPSPAFEHFTSRNESMKTIQEALFAKRYLQTGLALQSLGGAGKTKIGSHIIR